MMPPPTRLALLTLLSATATLFFFYKSRRRRLLKTLTLPPTLTPPPPRGKILFISETGTSKTLAQRLHTFLTLNNFPFDLVNPLHFEPEDLPKESLVLILASTWQDAKPPSNGEFLFNWLVESAEDFRVGSLLLKGCRFAVFGVGSKGYGEGFNVVGREIAEKMWKLGGEEVVEMGVGDVDDEGELEEVFDRWCRRLVAAMKGEGVGKGVEGVIAAYDSGIEASEEDEYEESDEEEEGGGEGEIVDLEDIAGKGPTRKKGVGVKENGRSNGVTKNGVKEMVTPVLRANLEKQVDI